MADSGLHDKDDEPTNELIPEEYDYDDDTDVDDGVLVGEDTRSPQTAPTHPVPSMQGPFEESILESERVDENPADSHTTPKFSAKTRHERLLSNASYNESYNAKWRAQPSAKWHPLSKILAQIVFGVHLLHQQLAKSDEEVVKILQRHVDEVDNFIQDTGEDFELALADIQQRIDYLKVPLEHVKIFDIMLDDRQFRNQIIDGNEKIEHIVGRTAQLMNDLLTDVHKGIETTTEMAKYLDKVAGEWPEDEGSLTIFNTMQANAEGWIDCFQNLQMQGNSLGVALVQLGSILNEMTKRAGVASRRSVVSRPSSASSATRHQSRSSHLQPASRYTPTKNLKPLPEDPDLVESAVAATLPRSQPGFNRHPIPFEERWEKPRLHPEAPWRQSKTPRQDTGEPPSIAENQKPALNPETAALTTFFRDTGPDGNRTPRQPRSSQTPRRVEIQESRAETPLESIPTTPTPKAKRTRSKLRRKTRDMDKVKDKASSKASITSPTLTSPAVTSPPDTTPLNSTRPASPSAPDSAYSSGSNSVEVRHASTTASAARPPPSPLAPIAAPAAAAPPSPPLASPARLPSAGKLSLFPSAANSVMSSRFPSELSLAVGGSGGGARPATSRASRRARDGSAAAAARHSGGLARRGSAPAGPDDERPRVRRMASLQGLRRWLSGGWRDRERSGEREGVEETRKDLLGIGESLEVVPEAY